MGAKLGQNNVRGERTRLAILEAAEEVFAEAGYRGSSLAAVAERAGVTQSGLLHHFRTKEELLQGVLTLHEVKDYERLMKPLSMGGLSVVDGLREVVLENAENRVAVRLFAVLVAECTTAEHPGHGYMRERYEKLRNRLVGSLSTGLDSGPFRSAADLEKLANVLIALMDGIQLQWIYNQDVDLEGAFELVSTILESASRERLNESQTLN